VKILQDGKEVSTISFGEVEFGMKKDILVEIQNDGESTLKELTYTANPEIHISNAPQTIAPHKSAYVTLSWIPDAKLQQPIQVNLEITGKEVFG
jgi:hypothetical protein